MEEKEYILSLDVSTTTIGVSLFENMGDYGKLQVETHISPILNKSITNPIEKLCLKARIFEEELINTFKPFNIKKVIIEEPLLNAKNVYTVATLLKFNGFISKIIFDKLNIIPDYISVHDSRSFAFPELVKVRTKQSKNGIAIPNKKISPVPVLFGDYILTYTNENYLKLSDEERKYYKKNGDSWKLDKKMVIWEKVNEIYPNIDWSYDKKNKLKKETFDAADSICCGIGFMKKEGFWK